MKLNKHELLDILFRLTVVILANIALSYATVWFLEPAMLYAGGATGIAQLFHRLFAKMGMANLPLGWYIFIINIPIVLIGIKFVSPKFTIYSIVAVIVQTIATNLIPFETSPFYDFYQILNESIISGSGVGYSLYGVMLTLSICGGVLGGIASGVALKYGTSTGGVDVIAQALALKKDISIGKFTMILNILVAIIGGGLLQGVWVIALFTIIRMILNSLVIDKIHTSYTYMSLHIFSSKAYDIAHQIMQDLHRGCTFENVTGGYSGKESIEVYCVLSKYEVEKAMKIIHNHDDHAFVTLAPVKKIKGNFLKKTIV